MHADLEFLELVNKMRSLQRSYFKTRRKSIMMLSIAAEKEVDKAIKAIKVLRKELEDDQ
jgi:hypothetical protein